MLDRKMNRKALLGVVGAFLAFGSVPVAERADAASLDSQLRSAVQRLIMGLNEGPVSKLSNAERKELAGCIYGVMSGIPRAKKEYIVQAKGPADLRARFDKVGLEDRAALKQQITRECAP